ncbi:MAG: glycosyltransferase family 4 protein [Armatimonadota bacterium]|nr:glycosyltransferase family 4 protein [bacterium]MDW8321314.1 glycosyltransferase family 4 protein [Armatimonadota bacterium]
MRIYFGAYWFLDASIPLINQLAKRHSLFVVTTHTAMQKADASGSNLLVPHLSLRCETPIKLKNPLYWWQRAAGVWQGVKRFRPDVIHLQEVADPFLDWLILRLKRLPLVLTVHDPTPHLGEVGFMKYYHQRRPLIEAVRRRADWVIVPGGDTRRQLLELHPEIPEQRVTAIPLGIYDYFLRWQRPEHSERPGTVLFFGRINAYKGLGVLLEAWERVSKECPAARLIIAGQGYDLPNYRERILHDPQCVLIDRFVSPHEVAQLFTEASLVVLPYVEATQSGVLSVAFAFGKPTVVTSVGSLPELVEEGVNGLVVPPRDPEALASAIIRLLRDENLRSRLKEGVRRLVSGRLSNETLAQQTEQVYLRAIAYRRGCSSA